MKPGAAYYRGGARVVIGGVPLRMARKPSKANLADIREYAKIADTPGEYWWNRKDRREYAEQCEKAKIAKYCDALGITRRQALRRIVLQKRAVDANPTIDHSLEYDL